MSFQIHALPAEHFAPLFGMAGQELAEIQATRSVHAIFVREHTKRAFPERGEVPEALTTRLISIRAFDDKHYMVNADVVDGKDLLEVIPAMLRDAGVTYLHLHNAKPGCFAAQVTRA